MFRPGNVESMVGGRTSEQLRRGELTENGAALLRELTEDITTDLGGRDELSTLQVALIDEAATLKLVLDWQRTELLDGGLLTSRGRLRAVWSAYLATVTKFQGIASTLGLPRRPRRIETLEEWMARQPTQAPRDTSDIETTRDTVDGGEASEGRVEPSGEDDEPEADDSGARP